LRGRIASKKQSERANNAKKRERANKERFRQRVEEVLGLLLDGATFADLRQFASQKCEAGEAPWDGNALSDRQLYRYIDEADAVILTQKAKIGRKVMFRRHLAKLNRLYAKQVMAGDYAAARQTLKDEAELRGFVPDKKVKLSGKVDTGPTQIIIEEYLVTPADRAASSSAGV
jgi:hypothetical protein